ncbi:SAV_2336 N-terminal domain-related protein [Streptomyces sp. NPDC002870]|uniref:SAV_2336 N-terminal domain-related protein n=1 Tax=Streptomyces sp. NPDC002870 TaxID=3364666 RepID=UPI0036932725
MTSDRLDTLARVLAHAAGEPPTGRELAELLWLARQMESPGAGVGTADGPASLARMPSPPVGGQRPRADPPQPSPPVTARDAQPPRSAPHPERVPLHTPAGPPSAPFDAAGEGADPDGGTGGGYAPLLAPAPPMLPRPLAIQRSVRPLSRRVPSAHGWELDETETVNRIATLGARRELWLPVLRPRRERWLHLRLVFDSGPTMPMWRPLLRDLRTAMEQTGAFRTVDSVLLDARGEVPQRHWERGRTAVMVISDCMGPQWREGPAGRQWYRTLRAWANELPVAVVQPLPERLWRHTAFPPAAGLLSAPGPGAANAALDFVPYESGPGGEGVPVPVLEPSPAWLGNWASLVATSGGTRIPGTAAYATARPPGAFGAEGLDLEDVEPEELVLRFRSLASRQAFRLAAHLAVGTAHLPVMRLVQAAIEERPEPQHLAEVVLSGMLKALPDAAAGSYVFRPGVREVLLGTLPRTALAATTRLLGRVSAQLESRAGAVPGEFRALVAGRGGPVGAALGDPFALVSRESVQLLRGPEPYGAGTPQGAMELLDNRYEVGGLLGRGATGEVRRAYDRSWRRPVAIKIYRFGAGVSSADREAISEDFVAQARHLASHPSLRHPQLAAVYDGFAQDGACFLVMELVEGGSLRELLARLPSGLVEERLTELARDLLTGIEVLHLAGFVHGDIKPANILMSPERGPVLCDYGVAWAQPLEARTPDRTATEVRLTASATIGEFGLPGTPRYLAPERIRSSDGSTRGPIDLYSLGCVLYELATGSYAIPGDDLQTVLRGHLEATRERHSPQLADLSPALRSVILELLDKDPRRRAMGEARLSALTEETLPSPSVPTQRLHYRVLGSPMAEDGATVLEVPYEPSVVLARLLLARGSPVPVTELRTLSPGAGEDLRGLVGRLQERGHPVRAADHAFVLPLDDIDLDLLDMERHVELAHEAQAADAPAEAIRHYDAALSLWDYEPLANVPGGWARAERQRFLDRRESLTRDRDDLLHAIAPDAAAWVVLEVVLPANVYPLEPFATALHVATGGFFESVPPPHRGHLLGQPSYVIRLPIPSGTTTSAVVTWAATTLPQRMVRLLPDIPAPVLMRVLVMEWGAELADLLPFGLERPGTGLVVTVGVSNPVHAGLDPELQHDFIQIAAGVAGRNAAVTGHYRVVDVARGAAAGPSDPFPSRRAQRQPERPAETRRETPKAPRARAPQSESAEPAQEEDRASWLRRLFPRRRDDDNGPGHPGSV